ncbi:MAG: hypothetical protein HYT90_01550 [Candidatus Omnitrophica bacterium]|nr:hypothetical protein [Candidatus Omnitrophota bacterium]
MTTTHRTSAGPPVALAAGLAMAAFAIVQWRATAVGTERVELAGEPWDRVREEFPIVSEPSEGIPEADPAWLDAVLNANPFSPQRRPVGAEEAEPAAGSAGGAAGAPITPQFLYKGHVNLGKRQRAVVEETTTGKTYFLEVGQEVAGFKVLDMSPAQVVLSDIKTAQQIIIKLKAEAEPQ